MTGTIFVTFSQLILMKIIKFVATRCQISRPKCTKFNFGSGSAPDPAGGAYIAPPDLLAVFKGPTSKGRGGKGGSGLREGSPLLFADLRAWSVAYYFDYFSYTLVYDLHNK